MPGPCPSTEQLAAALRERQSRAGDAELAAHLAECPACQTRLQELAGGSAWVQVRARAHTAAARPATDSLRQAIQALESRSPGPETDTRPTPKLDFLQPSDQPGLLGKFGSYEVLESVAIGGMGIVLKARDPGLDRIVALKVLPPALAANSLARARFIREARAAAAVVHEHVVPIYAVDECAGLPYLVMQFVQGRTLSERIRATAPLPVEEILRIGAQTAAGLAAAHAQGLIHRDVKPGNILLENGVERVKITDFGLARATDDSSLTHDGHIAGTPEYMSPEQANGTDVDQRADLFGLGCVLYEMATGISPFRAEKPLAALRRVCEENPPLAHTLNPKIPEWLSQLIQRMMAKDPAVRPQTAAEVTGELGARLAELQQGSTSNNYGRGVEENTEGGPRTLKLPVWVAVCIVSLFLVLALALLMRSPSSPQETTTLQSVVNEPTSAAGADGETNLIFLLSGAGDQKQQGFASLTEAVAAATPGAIIECRFNGVQSTPTLHLEDKPLLLRAAPGFEPVLMTTQPGSPLLHTRAALVLEGLILKTKQAQPATLDRPGRSHSVGMNVEGAPFLAAHCRFEVEFDPSIPARPPPESVRLLNVPAARFLNCEFVNRPGYAIAWVANGNRSSHPITNQLVVQGCTLVGRLLSRGGSVDVGNQLSLSGNTFCGDGLIMLPDNPDGPVQVNATNNVFALNQLIMRHPLRHEAAALEQLLRWIGGSNVYAIETTFAESDPRIVTHEAWLASEATAATASFSTELGLRNRFESLTDDSRAAEDAAFALTPEERQRLTTQFGSIPENLGADAERNGPGKPYDDWRASSAYQEWREKVREQLPEIAAEK